jgi:hypothetical protein
LTSNLSSWLTGALSGSVSITGSGIYNISLGTSLSTLNQFNVTADNSISIKSEGGTNITDTDGSIQKGILSLTAGNAVLEAQDGLGGGANTYYNSLALSSSGATLTSTDGAGGNVSSITLTPTTFSVDMLDEINIYSNKGSVYETRLQFGGIGTGGLYLTNPGELLFTNVVSSIQTSGSGWNTLKRVGTGSELDEIGISTYGTLGTGINLISRNSTGTNDYQIHLSPTSLKFLKTGSAPTVGDVWTASNVDGTGYWAPAGGGGGGFSNDFTFASLGDISVANNGSLFDFDVSGSDIDLTFNALYYGGPHARIRLTPTATSTGDFYIDNTLDGTYGGIYLQSGGSVNIIAGTSFGSTDSVNISAAQDITLTPGAGVIKLTGASTVGYVWTATDVDGSGDWAVAGSGGSSFADNVFEVYDNGDITKKLAFQVSGVTTATTRTLTVPNANGTIALTSDLQSWLTGTLTGNVSILGGGTRSISLGTSGSTLTGLSSYNTSIFFQTVTGNIDINNVFGTSTYKSEDGTDTSRLILEPSTFSLGSIGANPSGFISGSASGTLSFGAYDGFGVSTQGYFTPTSGIISSTDGVDSSSIEVTKDDIKLLPLSGAPTVGDVWTATNIDGSGGWAAAATGDVVGPASAVDNAIARFDTTTGKLIQNSQGSIDDSGNLSLGTDATSFRSIFATGSASDVSLSIYSKGTSPVNIYGDSFTYFNQASTKSFGFTTSGNFAWVVSGTGYSLSLASDNTARHISFTSSSAVSGSNDAGNINLATGLPTGAGLEGAVNIQTRAAGKLGFFNATAVIKQSAVTTAQGIADVLTAYGLLPTSTISGGGVGDMLLGTIQTVTALKTFNTGTFALRNPANTFSYNFLGSAIAADRTVTLPLLTGTDTFVFNDFAATLTNKTIAFGSNTVSGTKAQFNTAVTDGDIVFLDSVDTITGVKTMSGLNVIKVAQNGFTLRNPANTFDYTFQTAAIAAARTITLPLLTGNDVMVTEAFTQTLTNKTLGSGTVYNGGVISGQYGGTGVANTGFTITLGGNLATTGAFNTTFAVSGSNTITFPNAAITVARIDAAQTFTGVQTFSTAIASTSGGTGFNTTAIGDLLQGAATNTWAKLASVSAGSFLRSGGVTTASTWSTVKLPDTMSALGIWVANTANTTVNLTATAGQSIRVNAGGTAWEAFTPSGSGDMVLATAQTSTGKKTFSVSGAIAGINIGANATDPTTTLAAGDMYYQTGVGIRIYSGSAWSTVGAGGSGDVVGPASSVDYEIPVYNSTTGKLLKNSFISSNSSGDLILGTTGLAGLRNITVSSSDAAADLVLKPKGAGGAYAILTTGQFGVANSAYTETLLYSPGTKEWNLTAVNPALAPLIHRAASGNATNTAGGSISIIGGAGYGTGTTNAGNVFIESGLPNSGGVEGSVNIQNRSAGKLGFFAATPVVKQSAPTTAQEIADALTAYGLIPSATISGGGGSGLTYAQSKALINKS